METVTRQVGVVQPLRVAVQPQMVAAAGKPVRQPVAPATRTPLLDVDAGAHPPHRRRSYRRPVRPRGIR